MMDDETERERACVVVMEAGSEWPPSLDRRTADCAVIPQQPGESPGELALRASRRVLGLREQGVTLDAVVIAAGPRSDDEAVAGRRAVARSLVLAMETARAGELVFSAPSRISEQARHALVGLAGTLAGQARGRRLTVGVRFPPPGTAELSDEDARSLAG